MPPSTKTPHEGDRALSRDVAHTVVLVGHGSREARSNAAFLELVDDVRRAATADGALGVPPDVLGAFVEIASPLATDLLEGLASSLAQSARVTVVPVFLVSAAHVKRDVATAVDALRKRRPDVAVTVTEHLGATDSVVALLASRVHEVLGSPAHAHDDACVAFLTRGSSDAGALQEARELAASVARATGVTNVRVGFLAVREPSAEALLDEVGRDPAITVVAVLPHLMFDGKLAEHVRTQTVPAAQLAHPRTDYRVADVLAPDARLVDAIVDLVRKFSGLVRG